MADRKVLKGKSMKVGTRVKLKVPEKIEHGIAGTLPEHFKSTKLLKKGTIVKTDFPIKSNYKAVKFDKEPQYFLIKKKKLENL